MNRVTLEQIEAAIVRQDFFTAEQGIAGEAGGPAQLADKILAGRAPERDLKRLEQVTLCVLTLENGHVSVGVNYGPVDPQLFDQFTARRLAREHAIDQLWSLFGFALRETMAAAALRS